MQKSPHWSNKLDSYFDTLKRQITADTIMQNYVKGQAHLSEISMHVVVNIGRLMYLVYLKAPV